MVIDMINRLFAFILITTFFGCSQKYTPKPQGYFRIDFPEKKYHPLSKDYPYQFDVPDYSKIVRDQTNPDKNNWINVEVPRNKAVIHLSYYNLQHGKKPPKNILAEYIEESRSLAYKHTIKASAIGEKLFINPEAKVFGTIFNIEGNAASPMQFFLTDSTTNFLRGALYIRATPNIDSLKPVIRFLEADVVRLIETTSWN